MTTQGHIIVGTAGHIDHGKTSLVKVLTGVDTDRLKEEKERGITIELGFAPLTLPSGVRIGLVDVPGHERFVKNMVAGATGIDLVLLVVAADEGVMPQTREHLDICHLLGTAGGIVALTKTDLVDAEWLDMVTEDVREYLRGTFLDNAPIVPFSSVDGSGGDRLLSELERMAEQVRPRSAAGVFRLPIDRVFSMKGFGTVVTGTLISGKVEVGEEVLFYPGERRAKLRGIQVHGESVRDSAAGTRTALNLQGIDKEEIRRGQTAARPGSLQSTLMLDAQVRLLGTAARPLKNRDRVRLHMFTDEVMTRAAVLDGDMIEPGGEGLIQLRLESPAVALPGDLFILRSYSPMTTIGGGRVLDPLPPKRRRGRRSVLDHLTLLDTDNLAERIAAHLTEAGDHGMAIKQVAIRAGTSVPEALKILTGLGEGERVVTSGEGDGVLAYSADSFDRLKHRLVQAVAKYHSAHPTRTGIGREELRMRVARQLPDRPYRNLLTALEGRGEICVEGDNVRIAGYRATLTPEQEELAKKVISLVDSGGVAVPMLPEMSEELSTGVDQLKPVLNLLAERGDLVRIKDDYFIHPSAHQRLLEAIQEHFRKKDELTLTDFREIVTTTRKWMIPLLEYLDRTQVTMRKGDVRIKRGKAPSGG
ncbi:MAG: selenocysteine-specific translation elongation factor [bacterium]|nr:MAG: selenocysteine-specific translation elongation factor [bacterium]